MTFTKLFSSITASTVWCESSDTRVVWITMLAMSDKHGRVWASIPGLAKEAAVSVEACRIAVNKFLSPDEDSRTKVAEGRRIEPIDGGWRLINHAKYRAIRDEEERREYKAAKQREYRSVDNVDKSGHVKTSVDAGAHNAEAEAYTEAKKKPLAVSSPSIPAEDVFILLPTNIKDQRFTVSHPSIVEWSALYPSVDVRQQLRTMKGWLEGNPMKRKTKAGLPRFIQSWLAKAQDRPQEAARYYDRPRPSEPGIGPKTLVGDPVAPVLPPREEMLAYLKQKGHMR